MSGVISLASVGTLASIFPALNDYLVDHQRLASFITNTIPVILVASISLSICPLLLVVANKAETLVTGYDVHNAVIHRFWIFQVVRKRLVGSRGGQAIATDLFGLCETGQHRHLLLHRANSCRVVHHFPLQTTERPEQRRRLVSGRCSILRIVFPHVSLGLQATQRVS